ncbi:hypothetical protein ACWWD0_18305, partial [Pseudomonas aeruginosa]
MRVLILLLMLLLPGLSQAQPGDDLFGTSGGEKKEFPPVGKNLPFPHENP